MLQFDVGHAAHRYGLVALHPAIAECDDAGAVFRDIGLVGDQNDRQLLLAIFDEEMKATMRMLEATNQSEILSYVEDMEESGDLDDLAGWEKSRIEYFYGNSA